MVNGRRRIFHANRFKMAPVPLQLYDRDMILPSLAQPGDGRMDRSDNAKERSDDAGDPYNGHDPGYDYDDTPPPAPPAVDPSLPSPPPPPDEPSPSSGATAQGGHPGSTGLSLPEISARVEQRVTRARTQAAGIRLPDLFPFSASTKQGTDKGDKR